MSPIVRFAAIPHRAPNIAEARVALINWLFAASRGGTFLVRLDEADAVAATAESAIAIERDLLWLGLEWGAFARQSERVQGYGAAFERLRGAGRVYADGKDGGDEPVWRFRLEDRETGWDDLVQGRQAVEAAGVDDPIVAREDGAVVQMLASVVDDVDLGVTHIIRSADHIAKTSVQIQMFEALGATPPAFGHLPLLADPTGATNSDALAAITVESLRNDGIEAMAINSLMAGLGRPDPIALHVTPADLAAGFADVDLAAFGRAAAPFDVAQLKTLNARLLGLMPFAAVEKRLADMGLEEHADERFWNVVRHHVQRFAQVGEWYRICFADVPAIIEDLDLVIEAREVMPAEPWDGDTWAAWVAAAAARSKRSQASVARGLRLAVCGSDHGPEMDVLLPMIGRARALDRLGG